MNDYKHIFFDLDHTLWDFETNSKNTLMELFEQFNLKQAGISNFDHFYQTYIPINDQLWYLYHNKKVSKSNLHIGRFRETLLRFNIDNENLAVQMADNYLTESSKKQALFPQTIETLSYLIKRYTLHIITNGFAEVQNQKINNSGLAPYFAHTIISEIVGFQKPNPQIFDYAMQLSSAQKNECLMVGDNLQTDIAGAANAGIDTVFFNPKKKWHKANPTFEIYSMNELLNLL